MEDPHVDPQRTPTTGLVGLAISFALPAFTQEKEEVNPFPFHAIAASPQIVQQLEAINLKFDEAFNKHDAAAVAALFTANAIQVTPVGVFSGREAIEPYFIDLYERFGWQTRTRLEQSSLTTILQRLKPFIRRQESGEGNDVLKNFPKCTRKGAANFGQCGSPGVTVPESSMAKSPARLTVIS